MKLLSTLVLTMGLTAFVKADELAIQTSSRSGGDTQTLTFRAGHAGYFSVTGRFNDVAIVAAPNGVGMMATIRDLWNGNTGPLVLENRVQLPDGRSRVFLRINSVQPFFNGGSVTLCSPNGVIIDQDLISVR